MQSYNDGQVKNIYQIKDIKQALKDFSEGSSALYDLLEFCYYNGIETMACCSGEHEGVNTSYITFVNDGINYLNDIIDMVGICDYDVVYNSEYLSNPATVNIYYEGENKENFFRNIKSFLEKSVEENNIKRPDVFENIDDIKNSINNSFFLKDLITPSLIMSGNNADIEYTLKLGNPYNVFVTNNTNETFDSICNTMEKVDVGAIKGYFDHPLKIKLTKEELDTYSKKVKHNFNYEGEKKK